SMLDAAGHFAPLRFDRRMIEGGLGVLFSLGPRRGWSFKHTAEQAFQRPLAQENGTVLAQGDEGSPTPGRPFWLGLTVGQDFGNALGMASTGWAKRAESASWAFRAAQGCTEIHHGLGKVPGTLPRGHRHRERPDLGLGRRQRCDDRK